MRTYLKKSGKYVSRTMNQANVVQQRYQAMGAPSTQNVRNPLPMHTLVLAMLPVLPSPNAVVPVTKTIRTKALGQTTTKVVEEKQYASDVLGHDFYANKAVSVDDVVTKLREKGFIAVRGTVAMTLNNIKHSGRVESVRCQKPEGGPGSSYCRYFLATS